MVLISQFYTFEVNGFEIHRSEIIKRSERSLSQQGSGRLTFLEEPDPKLHFSNSTGGALHCVPGGAVVKPVISWLRQDLRPVKPVGHFFYYVIPHSQKMYRI